MQLKPGSDPLVPGPARFAITALPERRPVSVDLVSPTMPMHGVVRYPVESTDDGLVADVDIPMEGDWALYVNFDLGADAAEILFTVAPVDSAAAHHHH